MGDYLRYRIPAPVGRGDTGRSVDAWSERLSHPTIADQPHSGRELIPRAGIEAHHPDADRRTDRPMRDERRRRNGDDGHVLEQAVAVGERCAVDRRFPARISETEVSPDGKAAVSDQRRPT